MTCIYIEAYQKSVKGTKVNGYRWGDDTPWTNFLSVFIGKTIQIKEISILECTKQER